jgi:FlgN protein
MGLAEVSTVLWRERELLELLLFKLEEEQLLLSSGRTRWLPHATREVEIVLGQIREAELVRAVEVDGVAAELGLPTAPSLRALADAAPGAWSELLHGHREAFLVLTQEIAATAEANRDVLTAGQRAAHETLLSLGDPLQTYGPRGRSATKTAGTARSHLVDEAL